VLRCSEASALVVLHGIGRGLIPAGVLYKYAVGSDAINPSREAAVSNNFSGVEL